MTSFYIKNIILFYILVKTKHEISLFFILKKNILCNLFIEFDMQRKCYVKKRKNIKSCRMKKEPKNQKLLNLQVILNKILLQCMLVLLVCVFCNWEEIGFIFSKIKEKKWGFRPKSFNKLPFKDPFMVHIWNCFFKIRYPCPRSGALAIMIVSAPLRGQGYLNLMEKKWFLKGAQP